MKKRRKNQVLEQNVSARIDKTTYDALREEANSSGKTMSTLVREITEQHVCGTMAKENANG